MRLANIIIFLYSLIICSHVYAATFEILSLDENKKTQLRELKIWQESCPIHLNRLKLIKFSYYDFDNKEQQNGEIIVLDAAAKRALQIFKELHAAKFPISKARTIEHYKGNDEDSMADNNTSCFNCREVTGGGLPSIHAYGLAIDVNPVQNPFISFEDKGIIATKILPAQAKDYINRTNLRPGMAEKIIDIFKDNGFTVWGGKWNTPIDWQHFQPPRALAQLLATMSPADSEEFFEMYANARSILFDTVKHSDNPFLAFYNKSPEKFMKIFRNHKTILNMDLKQTIQLIEKEVTNISELAPRQSINI